jgi:hypothetical protein
MEIFVETRLFLPREHRRSALVKVASQHFAVMTMNAAARFFGIHLQCPLDNSARGLADQIAAPRKAVGIHAASRPSG